LPVRRGGGMGVDGGCGCGCVQGPVRWPISLGAAYVEVERLVGEDPGLLGAKDDGAWTPLRLASERGHLEVVRFLLDYPAARSTINSRDEWGMTALWGACFSGRGEVVRRRMTMMVVLMMMMTTMMTAGEGAAKGRGRSHHRRQQRHHPHGHRQAGSPVLCLRLGPPGVRGGAGGEVFSSLFFSPGVCSCDRLAEA
jgi:hypothetical protein